MLAEARRQRESAQRPAEERHRQELAAYQLRIDQARRRRDQARNPLSRLRWGLTAWWRRLARPPRQTAALIPSHAEEAITLKQVLQHVNANRFHFCKIFKKTTGMTLTEYVARVRVVKAKALLADPSRRISEVVFAAGFGSIPQFNNVFKRFVGMPPSAYRATLRAQPPSGSLPG